MLSLVSMALTFCPRLLLRKSKMENGDENAKMGTGTDIYRSFHLVSPFLRRMPVGCHRSGGKTRTWHGFLFGAGAGIPAMGRRMRNAELGMRNVEWVREKVSVPFVLPFVPFVLKLPVPKFPRFDLRAVYSHDTSVVPGATIRHGSLAH